MNPATLAPTGDRVLRGIAFALISFTIFSCADAVVKWLSASHSIFQIIFMSTLFAFIPVGVELTCYYYAFLAGFALLHERSEKVGIWLLAATAATQFVAWRPFESMPGWRDEQYTLMSAATLLALLLIVIHFARQSGSSPVNGRPKGSR